MKLYHEAFAGVFDLTDEKTNVIIVENECLFYSMIKDFTEQLDGNEGRFILSKGDVPVAMGNHVDFVRDLFSIKNNGKSLMTKIKNHIASVASNEENFFYTADLISSIEKYVGRLLMELDYPVCIQDKIDISSIIKSIDFTVEQNCEDVADMICNHIRTMATLFDKKVFVFFNLKQFVPQREMQQIYKFCRYEKICLLLFEGVDKYCLPDENRMIIDKDLCTI